MPKLFSSFSECFGFSQTTKSLSRIVSIALSEMSFKLPIGVATIKSPVSTFFILLLFTFIISCTPVNLSTNTEKEIIDINEKEQKNEIKIKKTDNESNIELEIKSEENLADYKLSKNVTLLFSNNQKEDISRQFVNILELGAYNKELQNISFEINFFKDDEELIRIISEEKENGKIFIGPIQTRYTKALKNFCNNKLIFFSFSSDTNLAGDCIYLLNFFPKNELEQLFSSLSDGSKVALLYPENEYGYMINSIIDDIVNKTEAIIINRSSYKNDLSNVRDAIKELGKYNLRKYELNRQKKILISKNDRESKKRLKKLNKFNTTNDYDFTHILIADYGLNLLQVAPLLPYYDIDPNIVQFLGTGVIDDENFFVEPSLQGTIFPGVEKEKRQLLINQYEEIYEENLYRISTLPYDLLGLLNYVFLKDLSINQNDSRYLLF